jgi:hypothetical protein
MILPPGLTQISQTLLLKSGDRIVGDREKLSTLQWIGADGGTMVQFKDGDNAVDSFGLDDFLFDANNKASTFIKINNGVHGHVRNIQGIHWKNGFAVVLTSSGSIVSGWQHWDGCDFYYSGEHGYGLSMGVTGPQPGSVGDLDQINFSGCSWCVSNELGAIGLLLGSADHVMFYGGGFYPQWEPGSINPIIGICVQPQKPNTCFPGGIGFFGTAIASGIKYDTSLGNVIGDVVLNFYPYYTDDGEFVPPLDWQGKKTLPDWLANGITNYGVPFGIQAAPASPPSSVMINGVTMPISTWKWLGRNLLKV